MKKVQNLRIHAMSADCPYCNEPLKSSDGSVTLTRKDGEILSCESCGKNSLIPAQIFFCWSH